MRGGDVGWDGDPGGPREWCRLEGEREPITAAGQKMLPSETRDEENTDLSATVVTRVQGPKVLGWSGSSRKGEGRQTPTKKTSQRRTRRGPAGDRTRCKSPLSPAPLPDLRARVSEFPETFLCWEA